MTKKDLFSNDLIEAFRGYYESEWALLKDQSEENIRFHIEMTIAMKTCKERLEIYLEWNGIIGYTSRIWEITQGEL